MTERNDDFYDFENMTLTYYGRRNPEKVIIYHIRFHEGKWEYYSDMFNQWTVDINQHTINELYTIFLLEKLLLSE